jgi:hypothetical protein
MKFNKKYLKNIFNGLIAIIVFSEIVSLVIGLSLLLYLNYINPSFILSSTFENMRLVFSLSGFFVLTVGFYYGYSSRKKNNLFYKIFEPNKGNIKTNLILAFIFLIIILVQFIISKGAVLILPTGGFMYINSFIFTIIVGIITNIIAFFPFSALIYYIYKNRKNYRKLKVAILLLFLLNPLSIIYSLSLNAIYKFHASNEPCGIVIVGFTENSPAERAGMNINETIIQLDQQEIRSQKDLSEYLKNITSPREIFVKTENNEYKFNLTKNKSGKIVIGIIAYQKFCKR